jgi:hypothetical protein
MISFSFYAFQYFIPPHIRRYYHEVSTKYCSGLLKKTSAQGSLLKESAQVFLSDSLVFLLYSGIATTLATAFPRILFANSLDAGHVLSDVQKHTLGAIDLDPINFSFPLPATPGLLRLLMDFSSLQSFAISSLNSNPHKGIGGPSN